MTRKLVQIIFFVYLVTGIVHEARSAYPMSNPYDPVACVAAEKAVFALGPSRGAAALISDIRNIEITNVSVDSQGQKLAGSVEDLNQAIQDLNAQVTQTKITIEISSDILFDFDKWDVKPDAVDELTKLSVIVKQKAKRAEILGYTDSKGGEAYNQNLSLKRANSVMNWLVQNAGVNSSILSTKGLGESKPKVSNTKPNGQDDPEGRAKNRRVEVVVTIRS